MQKYQEDLVRAWTDYAAGRIDEKALKGRSAGFGIYQQRDLNAMMRLRRTGGIVTSADLADLARIMRRFAIPFIHLTSRQDLQFHGVRPADVPAVLAACEDAGFPFRGGGGDTFRNAIVSVNSGLCQGCGACNVACRTGAIDLRGFTNAQILKEVDALCL